MRVQEILKTVMFDEEGKRNIRERHIRKDIFQDKSKFILSEEKVCEEISDMLKEAAKTGFLNYCNYINWMMFNKPTNWETFRLFVNCSLLQNASLVKASSQTFYFPTKLNLGWQYYPEHLNHPSRLSNTVGSIIRKNKYRN